MSGGNPWSPGELKLLGENYPATSNREIAAVLGRTEHAVTLRAKKMKLKKSDEYLRAHPGRGRRARMEIGQERMWDGYLYRKVGESGSKKRDWIAVHVLLWEEHFGPVPPNHLVMFRDGDKTRIEIDNLELVSRVGQMLRYSIMNLPAQLREVIWLKGALTRKINAHDN
jgi:hypothetical protein